MKFLLLLLFSPAVVICTQRLRKTTDPNDEPFLPIYPEYPYNPKLMKRGINQSPALQLQQQQQQQQQQPLQQQLPQQGPQSLAELYAPKVDARDAYAASYGPNSSPYAASPFDSYLKSTGAVSPYSLANYGVSPYGLLGSYTGTPYGASAAVGAYPATPAGQTAAATTAYGASLPGAPSASPYAQSPYANYFYQLPPSPYYYPGYYGQPPYGPLPPYPYKPNKDEDEDDDEDDRRLRGKNRSKSGGSGRNRIRADSDREAVNNQYVDGGNFIISSAKDLDGESSTHRTPTTYNQIEDSDTVHPRTVILPKATYRLVSVSQQQQPDTAPAGYIKIQQLEQLMRQALAKLLAQNAAQQASLVQIQEAAQANNPYNSGSGIAKTGLSYVVNPSILNRVLAPGQYSPSQLINTKPKPQLYAVSTTQSKGSGSVNQEQQDYGDYDSPPPSDAPTATSSGSSSTFQPTAEPSHQRGNYPYSTYRPTQQTSLEDVNFGSKQKSKS